MARLSDIVKADLTRAGRTFECIGCGGTFVYADGGLDCFKCHYAPFCYECVKEHREDCTG